ncbi:MAG: hypothetical protein FJ395_17380 [Verrucomicrobia bacterium]|nr:hypothetical protein [Verrucomicrobiota bacterium]
MSLISDALKRTQQNSPSPVSRPQPPPRKASPIAAGAAPESPRNFAVVVLLAIVLMAGAALFGLWRLYSMVGANAKNVAQTTATEPLAPREKPSESAPLSSAIPGELEAAMRAAQADPPKVEPPKAEPPKVEQPAPPPPPPAPRELPKLLLQGVTIYGGAREALINGQTVGVGDVIEEASVVAIEARSVKMRFEGREFILRLP